MFSWQDEEIVSDHDLRNGQPRDQSFFPTSLLLVEPR